MEGCIIDVMHLNAVKRGDERHMKKLIGYSELPEAIVNQIDKVVAIWKKHTEDNLVGVYLHGSIILNAFCPESGDIDILIVVKKSLDIATKLAIAEDIMKIDQVPCPLEMSAILLEDAKAWRTPGNCVFHYSDFWTKSYEEKIVNVNADCYIVDNEFPDADITSYIRLIRQCGIVLYGKDISEVFCDISDKDFWKAISEDIDEYDFHAYNPRYFASNVLILGRILSFKKERRILSKYESGLWMIDYVPKELKYLPELAMKIWFEQEEHEMLEDDLEKLRIFLVNEISSDLI